MRRYVIAPTANRDVKSILEWSSEHFGDGAAQRYELLIGHAVLDVAENPERTGAVHRTEIAANARTYHLRNSRSRAAGTSRRVEAPRHFLLFRLRADGAVEVGRVLHDHMDLIRHLPPGYAAGEAECP